MSATFRIALACVLLAGCFGKAPSPGAGWFVPRWMAAFYYSGLELDAIHVRRSIS